MSSLSRQEDWQQRKSLSDERLLDELNKFLGKEGLTYL
jgi:hypothetical protein